MSRTPTIHSLACSCAGCRQPESMPWGWLAPVLIGAAVALAIDLGGYTPALAGWLGMMS